MRIQITFEKIIYCEKFECDSTCISFRRPNMNPVWCPTQGFQDILELPSIAQLNLNMRINFAGDTVPSELKSSNYRTFFKTNFSEILREFGVSDLEFKAGVIRFYKRYQFECRQSPLLIYSCGLKVSNKILDGGVRGPPQEFYQPMHEDGVRLTKSASGYSLKIQAVATIHHLSFSGILVVLGMFYISTIICKNTLELFFASSPQIKAQKDADLDFAKHLKSD